MEYKHELKLIDTQEKAYLLGFLYGDGTITSYIEKDGRLRYLTKISICDTDRELINTFKSLFPFFNEGEFDYSIYNENSANQTSVAKSSKELFDDLKLNGLYTRKSYENAPMLKIPNIKDNLIPHFIRGFFDADGSVYTQSNRKNLIRIELCSVSKKLLESIDQYLKTFDINAWKLRPKPPTKENWQTVHSLEFIKTSEVMKLINFMYKDYTIALKRKADKCLNHVVVNKVIDRNICCSKCNSNKVTKNGNRSKSTRYKCTDCGKGFSLANDT